MASKGKGEASKVDEVKSEGQKCNLGEHFGISDAYAKAMLYIIPVALYVPWAYRMFKGTPCGCPKQPPAYPPRSQSRCQQSRSRSGMENRESSEEMPCRSKSGGLKRARKPPPRGCRDAPWDDLMGKPCPQDCGNSNPCPKRDAMDGCQEHLDGRRKKAKSQSCED